MDTPFDRVEDAAAPETKEATALRLLAEWGDMCRNQDTLAGRIVNWKPSRPGTLGSLHDQADLARLRQALYGVQSARMKIEAELMVFAVSLNGNGGPS